MTLRAKTLLITGAMVLGLIAVVYACAGSFTSSATV